MTRQLSIIVLNFSTNGNAPDNGSRLVLERKERERDLKHASELMPRLNCTTGEEGAHSRKRESLEGGCTVQASVVALWREE